MSPTRTAAGAAATLLQVAAMVRRGEPAPLWLQHDWCAAGMWSIDPKRACPVCGAEPDTRCKMEERR